MILYEKFGKDEDLAEKERTFKNDKGDMLTVKPIDENKFTLHHVASSGKEWSENHSRERANLLLDRFFNKGLNEDMEDNFVNEASLHESATHSVKLKQDIHGYKKGQRVKTILATNLPYKDNHWIHQGKWKDHPVGARLEPEDYEDVKKLNEDEQLDEGVSTKYKYQGKTYNTKAFKTVKGANAFMEKNPQHGLLDVEKDDEGKEKYYHVASVKEETVIDHIVNRNHADAIPQLNDMLMRHVHSALDELFPQVAETAFNKVDEEKNPYISPRWPAKLHKKIDAYHNGKYIGSSNAYKSLKDAKHGFAHHNKLDHSAIKTFYSDDEKVRDTKTGKELNENMKKEISQIEKGQPHGIKGHINVFVKDHDSHVTGYGKHDRVVAFQPDHEGLYMRVDHHHGLGMPSHEQMLKVAKSHPNNIRGKWKFHKAEPHDDGKSTDIYFKRDK